MAQTPYLSFPGSKSIVERIAGATTDIQYLSHQGSSYFSAAYWVGANALIRYKALQDIRKDQVEAGKTVVVFVQDRTVIEDTGSTIDLLIKGWLVKNHFSPLAYSATPADFGALAIQRKRWSNGGLIIAPSLLQRFFGQPWGVSSTLELLLRSNYLLSPLIGNSCVFLLMLFCNPNPVVLGWMVLAVAPYFILYGVDLRRLNYKFSDLISVCALNLVLLPVGFAGIWACLRQIATGRKTSFERTPKVANRTFIPPIYMLFNFSMMTMMVYYTMAGVVTGDTLGLLVPLLNLSLYSFGVVRLMGLRNFLSDAGLALRVVGGFWSAADPGALTENGREKVGHVSGGMSPLRAAQ